MARPLTCPQGHRFDLTLDDCAGAGTRLACPICGALCNLPGNPTATDDLANPAETTTAHFPSPTAASGEVTLEMASIAAAEAALRSELPTVPGYELLEKLGQGGMGVVFKARHLGLNRVVALKMILGNFHDQPQQLARFQIEAEALASLPHPHIVQIHDVGTHQGCPFFAMELVDGGSLQQKLAGRPQPPREAARLVELLARAMHAAHQRGIIHRDLKPVNVLLTRDGAPKIVDFGLAKRLQEDDDRTLPGVVMGTPNYMAPEQAAGRPRDVGPATDVHALGIILYEMLTGKAPFRGPTATVTLDNVLRAEPAAPGKVQPRVPRDLDVICLKCLQKQPARRYATAEALADDLRRFLAHEPILARPAGAGERLVKWVRRHPTAAALAAVLLAGMVAAVVSCLWYNMRLRDERDRAEKNFQMALRAVDEMLTEVGEEQLAHEPNMEGKRRIFLERALEFYRQLFQDKHNDPLMRRHVGLGYKRVGDIHRLLGQYDKAQEAYVEAIALLEPLAAEFARQPEHRQHLADSWNFRGELFRLADKHEEAEKAYRMALQVQTGLVQEFADRPEFGKDLARTHYNLGLLFKDTGQPAKAHQQFQAAIVRLEKLAGAFATRPEYRQHLARAYLNLGTVLRRTEGFEPARTAMVKATDLYRVLAAKFPVVPEYRHELAVGCNNLGNLYSRDSQYQEAAKYHRESLALLQKLVTSFSSVPQYRAELANTHNSLAVVLAQSNQLDQAKTVWLAGEEYLKTLVADFPHVPAYRGDLGMTRSSLGWLLLKQKDAKSARDYLSLGIEDLDLLLQANPNQPEYLNAKQHALLTLGDALATLRDHAAAAKAAAAAVGIRSPTGRSYFKAAEVLARCHALALNEANLADDQRQALARTYAAQAVRWLRLAVDNRFNDLAKRRLKALFAPLGDLEDLAALMQRLQ